MTPREAQVASLVAEGLGAVEIAMRLGMSPRTVKAYKNRAARGLGYKGKRLDVFLVGVVCGRIASRSRLAIFSARLRRTAQLAAKGLTNPEIGESIGISAQTVRNYLREIFDVAGVWNRRELARFLLSGPVGSERNAKQDSPPADASPEPWPGVSHMTKPSMASTAT